MGDADPLIATDLLGHDDAVAEFAAAHQAGRMHHAWLLTGPAGIGKAHLARQLAARLLAPTREDAGLFGENGETEIDWTSSEARQVLAGSHSDLRVITRSPDPKTGKMRKEIAVSQVRDIANFFSQTTDAGGWRVAIIDSADEMNVSAANALLKSLEEPPQNTVVFLVCHRPGRILPTIRSRCRTLTLRPLKDDAMKAVLERTAPELEDNDKEILLHMAAGSPGHAIQLLTEGGLDLYREILTLLASPRLDMMRLHSLAGKLGPIAADAAYRLFLEIYSALLGDIIRAAATGNAPASPTAKLAQGLAAKASLDRWLELWEKMGEMTARTDAVNLDRKQVIILLFTQIHALTSQN